MRCRACARTVAPSQSRTFSGFDFCQRCYDALGLKDLEKKELKGYFLSASSESTRHFYEALVAVASKFDKKGREKILLRCMESMMGNLTPLEIISFLLAARALQESEGSEPLTVVGELTLINVAKKLAPDFIRVKENLFDLSEDEFLERAVEVSKKHYGLCIDVLNELSPSEYTEILRKDLKIMQESFNMYFTQEEITSESVEEGLHLTCSEELSTLLRDTFGQEHVFHGWDEFKNALVSVDEKLKEGSHFSLKDEEYQGDIHLVVGEGELYVTSSWERIKAGLETPELAKLQEEVPAFVLEQAAGGMEVLQGFVEKVLSENETVNLIKLYASLLDKQEKYEEAIRFLEEKISHNLQPELLTELAGFYHETSQSEKALELLQKVSDMDPENWAVLLFMGRIHEDIGEFGKAKDFYEKAQKIGPKTVGMLNFVQKAETGALISEIEELISEENYEKALEMVNEHFDPVDISVFHYYKGLILSRKKDTKTALGIMTDYLDIYPDDEDGWLEKAEIYLDLGQFAAAARCFRRCAALSPHDIRPLVWEALCHKRMGRSRDYKRCINQARKIDAEGTKALLKGLL